MFEYTQNELEDVISKYFISTDPLKLKDFPSKEKKKYLCLIAIICAFEKGKQYSEKEVNEILKSIYPYDYCTIRRYLVDYRFLTRQNNGRLYWVTGKNDQSF